MPFKEPKLDADSPLGALSRSRSSASSVSSEPGILDAFPLPDNIAQPPTDRARPDDGDTGNMQLTPSPKPWDAHDVGEHQTPAFGVEDAGSHDLSHQGVEGPVRKAAIHSPAYNAAARDASSNKFTPHRSEAQPLNTPIPSGTGEPHMRTPLNPVGPGAFVGTTGRIGTRGLPIQEGHNEELELTADHQGQNNSSHHRTVTPHHAANLQNCPPSEPFTSLQLGIPSSPTRAAAFSRPPTERAQWWHQRFGHRYEHKHGTSLQHDTGHLNGEFARPKLPRTHSVSKSWDASQEFAFPPVIKFAPLRSWQEHVQRGCQFIARDDFSTARLHWITAASDPWNSELARLLVEIAVNEGWFKDAPRTVPIVAQINAQQFQELTSPITGKLIPALVTYAAKLKGLRMDPESLKCYEIAGELGSQEARGTAGQMHFKGGRSVKRDLAKAQRWFTLANET